MDWPSQLARMHERSPRIVSMTFVRIARVVALTAVVMPEKTRTRATWLARAIASPAETRAATSAQNPQSGARSRPYTGAPKSRRA